MLRNAPVTYLANAVGTPDSIFTYLWDNLPWEQREAPRRECWFNPYGQDYTYGTGEHARTYRSHPLAAFLGGAGEVVYHIMASLNDRTGSRYDCCFINGYEHGRQHLGWHSDDSPEMDADHPIATVSLGAEREIWFRPVGDKSGENVEKLMLGHGSAAIMAAGMQQTWQHRIPKSPKADCGPRLSLTYRRLVR